MALDSRTAIVTKKHNVLSSEERLEEVLSNFGNFTRPNFRQKVCEFVIRRGGHAKIGHCIPKKKVWDGLLELHFSVQPTAQEVVCLVKAARADDFGMSDDKTLWFWWD